MVFLHPMCSCHCSQPQEPQPSHHPTSDLSKRVESNSHEIDKLRILISEHKTLPVKDAVLPGVMSNPDSASGTNMVVTDQLEDIATSPKLDASSNRLNCVGQTIQL
jgi:hypothetical protein